MEKDIKPDDTAVSQTKEEFEQRKNSGLSVDDLLQGNDEKDTSINEDLDQFKDPNEKSEDEVSVEDEFSEDESNGKETTSNDIENELDKLEEPEHEEEITEADRIEEEIESAKMSNMAPVEHRPTHIDDIKEELAKMEGDEFTRDKIFDEIQRLAKQELSGDSNLNKIDLDTFTIASDPVNLIQSMETSTHNTNIADWVLMSTGKRISMSEFSGLEIQRLNPANSRRNQYNTMMDIFTNIYDHCVNDTLADSVEGFLKSIHFVDLDHIMYAAYRASFNDSNKVTYICPHCNHVFITDVDMDDMYRFESDEAEERFWKIHDYGGDNVAVTDVAMHQMSDDYVAELAMPSIYTTMVESALLDTEFLNEYSDIIGISTMVKNIYKIDRATNQLVPIALKTYHNDRAKTLKYKILNYAQIIISLNSYNKAAFDTAIEKVGEGTDSIEYLIPGTECEKCKKKIEDEVTTADDLIFIRHRLDVLANTTSK